MNLQKAFDFFRKDLSDYFNPIPVLFNYPKPFHRIKFPYISLFTVRSDRNRFLGNRFLLREITATEAINYFTAGDILISLNLQYFAEAGKTSDLYDFQDRFTDYIHKEFTATGDGKRCLTLKYGDKPFETALVYLNSSHTEQTNGESIKSGINRVLFDLMFEMSEIIINRQPLVKEVVIEKSEISEHVNIG